MNTNIQFKGFEFYFLHVCVIAV